MPPRGQCLACMVEAKIEKFLYISILWSGNWFKVVEDAQMMAKKK